MTTSEAISFNIDHNLMSSGLYISCMDPAFITYDLRFRKPNTTFLSASSSHSIEHLLATDLRGSYIGDQIVYVGPMGCLTGFYVVTRASLTPSEFLTALLRSTERAATIYDTVPGSLQSQCGDFKSHDLEQAKLDLKYYNNLLRSVSLSHMSYPK